MDREVVETSFQACKAHVITRYTNSPNNFQNSTIFQKKLKKDLSL
jgi:hypothetical protein